MALQTIDGIEVEIVQKRIKNLNLRITQPEGRVIASIPIGMESDAVHKFIRSKKKWIQKQQTRIAEKDFEKPLQFESGEEHYLFGKKYPLLIKEGSTGQGVLLSSDTITLLCKKGSGPQEREQIMDRWYKENLLKNLPDLVEKWENLMGLKVNEIRVRKMKTRWGTCNPGAGRIWISLMLAKRRPELVEYIVVHEMVHLLERGHNKRFYSYMDKYLPDWKKFRKELK